LYGGDGCKRRHVNFSLCCCLFVAKVSECASVKSFECIET
jgi:hypothetical protein